jgi:pyridoxine 5-phosphate synthase
MAELRKVRLGVNIDHVATLRNARGGGHPDPVRAAKIAVAAGADGITFHLREDRRHIRDEDVRRLKDEVAVPLNFEMAATDEMVKIVLLTRPHAACIVPERREERTTEGGLDAAGQHNHLAPIVEQFSDAGIRTSLFIAADPRQVETAARLRAPVIEIHTGAWCEAVAAGKTAEAGAEFDRIRSAVRQAAQLGIEVHAGHGLDYATAETISGLPEIAELNIGHFIVGEAVFAGLEEVIRGFRAAMERGRARAPGRAA